MSRFRGQRPLTLSERTDFNPNGLAHLNYVLRRYGGLDVYIPRIQTDLTERAPIGSAAPPPPIVATEPTSSASDFNINQHAQPVGPNGRFTPLFGGRIVLGPEKKIFFTSLAIMLSITVLIIIEKDSIERLSGGPFVFYTGLILSFFSILTFIRLGITDPGVVPKNYSLQELVIETADFRARHPHLRFYKYCQKCRAYRPPRTYHCSRCQVCIRQQDLHLFPGGICVGERNRRAYFFTVIFQTLLGFYLIFTNIIIYVKVRIHARQINHLMTGPTVKSLLGTLAGFFIIFIPQSGIFMFIYRMYLISVGRTAREEYRKFRYFDATDCVIESHGLCMNVCHFFFRSSFPSVFRRRVNRIDPERCLPTLPTQYQLDQILRRHQNDDEINNNQQIDMNVNEVVTIIEIDEALRLRELAEFARGRSTPSVPLFEQEMNHPTTRIRMPRKSKPSSIIQQKILAFQESRCLPRATISYHKRNREPLTLSEGCIPRTKDGIQEMIQLARATQLRRIIQMILMRDRPGLVEMSRRVNIAALVGMNRFDPDNLQLLELNNGLPMIAPRRREVDQGHNQPRLGAGVLGIPQMVAAGLLPTARDLADSVEAMLGRGRIRRLPPVGRQRYVPITVVDPPRTRRGMSTAEFRDFIEERAARYRATGGIGTNRGTSPPHEVEPTISNLTDDIGSNQNQLLIPAVRPSVLQTNILPVVPRVLNENRSNNATFHTRNFYIGPPGMTTQQPTIFINDGRGGNMVSNPTFTRPPSSQSTTVRGPFPHTPRRMVVIPIFSDSDE
ncbi:unnamed protein product [Orchesella dallaii]|uniref:Palmitoyltransferase n=1 Tax=Orchesella dallaii TaxID=48710 RepID=A0ABP1S3V6_9HEXA